LENQNLEAEIFLELKRIFGNDNVKKEWDVAKNSRDAFTRELYCPRIDYVVGPFNIDANVYQNGQTINECYDLYRDFLRELHLRSGNDEALEANHNPRCFLAIELENKTSKKHRIGSLINASAMGKIGIVVAANSKVFQSYVKIRKYLKFLEAVGKIQIAPKNIIVLTQADFLQALRDRRRTAFKHG
jgi:hypothetical protein